LTGIHILWCPKGDATCAANEVDAAIKEPERQDQTFPWEMIAEREDTYTSFNIEPGETQKVDFEFATSSEVNAVRVYAYFRNEKLSNNDSEIGWTTYSYYDFRAHGGGATK
jgi:hypothetical protein